ncbi:MAG: hypothetical protein AAF211_04000 [Myxococcota bacterium]
MLNVVVEGVTRVPATVDDAVRWRDQFSLGWDVLADTDEEWVTVWGDASSRTFSQHSYTVIDRDGRVVWNDFGEDRNVVGGIDAAVDSIE